jgi:ribosomal protein S18 acetylase RimI-like enzyme
VADPVIVRRLRADEAALFKTLRLRALADAPAAFAHSHDEVSAEPDAYWAEMTRSVTEPGRHAMFVAEDEEAVGMSFGLVDRERSSRAHLGGMWVAPTARHRGVGRALGDAVLAWARERGFADVVLWVTEGNADAVALYERMGFACTGRRDRLPSSSGLAIYEMGLAL